MIQKLPLLKAKIPSTGEEICRIGLGTYKAFDVGEDVGKRKELQLVLSEFLNRGGTLIDSSPMYGSSEKVIGDLSSTVIDSPKHFVATKVWTTGEASGIEQMQSSMKKLQRQNIDLMQIHNLVDWKTQLKTLRKWKDQGLIKYIGAKTWSQYFLKFILSSPEIQFVIPATSRIEHLKDNMSTAFGELPSEKQRQQMVAQFI